MREGHEAKWKFWKSWSRGVTNCEGETYTIINAFGMCHLKRRNWGTEMNWGIPELFWKLERSWTRSWTNNHFPHFQTCRSSLFLIDSHYSLLLQMPHQGVKSCSSNKPTWVGLMELFYHPDTETIRNLLLPSEWRFVRPWRTVVTLSTQPVISRNLWVLPESGAA